MKLSKLSNQIDRERLIIKVKMKQKPRKNKVKILMNKIIKIKK